MSVSSDEGQQEISKEGLLDNNSEIAFNRDEAKITTTSVSYDGVGGYNVEATLDFHGFTNTVDMKLLYTGSTFFGEDSGLHGAPFSVAGFVGTFEFNALTDFGIESSNIADRVVVRCNIQFKKPG